MNASSVASSGVVSRGSSAESSSTTISWLMVGPLGFTMKCQWGPISSQVCGYKEYS